MLGAEDGAQLVALSPDGKRIAFYSTRMGNRDIYTMDVDGGSLEHVTALPGQERFPTWSPDGTRLAFASSTERGEDVCVIARAASGQWGEPTRLTTTGAGYPRWSPDGRFILAASQGRIVVVPGARRYRASAADGGVTRHARSYLEEESEPGPRECEAHNS